MLTASRRSQLVAACGVLLSALLLLHVAVNRDEAGYRQLWPSEWATVSSASIEPATTWGVDDPALLSKLREVDGRCSERDDFEHWYGRTNLRMSRGYEGE